MQHLEGEESKCHAVRNLHTKRRNKPAFTEPSLTEVENIKNAKLRVAGEPIRKRGKENAPL